MGRSAVTSEIVVTDSRDFYMIFIALLGFVFALVFLKKSADVLGRQMNEFAWMSIFAIPFKMKLAYTFNCQFLI